MKKLFLFLVFLHVSSSVKHTIKFAFATTTGIPNLPQFMFTVLIDDTKVYYCDSNRKTEVIGNVAKTIMDEYTEIEKMAHVLCFEALPNFLKVKLYGIMQLFNQTKGLRCLEVIQGSEWDQTTGEIFGYSYYGYDGEDLISLDLKTLTWIPLKPEAVVIKQNWDKDKAVIKDTEGFVTQIYPEWLQMYLNYENRSPIKTVPPSVSVLQKSPSSPISCFATGFYPNRADMFWRRDGEQTHEDVDHGEILPNPDGTFQMRVDLDLSSVRAQDWSRYDCVFQLSGVKDDIITKLDRAGIRTNEETLSNATALITAAAAVCALVLMASTAFMAYKKRKAKCRPLDVTGLDHSSELSEELNPKT